MRFQITQSELLKSLNIVEKGIQTKTIIESLKGIKIVVKEDCIVFTTAKTELAIEYTLRSENLKIEETGTAIVLGTQFINLVKKISEDEGDIHLFKESSNILHIKTKYSKIDLVTFNPAEYPDTNFNVKNELVTVNKRIFLNAYKKAKHSAGVEDVKMILQGINLKFSPDSLIVSTTDSKRLTYLIEEPIPQLDRNYIINKSIFSDLVRILELIVEDEIRISQDDNQFVIKTDNLQIKSRLIDGVYPDTRVLIPESSTFGFEIDTVRILNALSKIDSFTDRANSVVTLQMEDGQVLIKFFVQELGGYEERIEVQNVVGTPFRIAFVPAFVVEALHSIADDTVKFEFAAETSPFKVTGVTNDNNIQIISPIRMSND